MGTGSSVQSREVVGGNVVSVLPKKAAPVQGVSDEPEPEASPPLHCAPEAAKAAPGAGVGRAQRLAWPQEKMEEEYAWSPSGAGSAPRAVHLQGYGAASSHADGGAGGFCAGQAVRIHGLENSRHLNGEEGVLQTLDAEGGRWLVRLRTGEEKKIRAANLALAGGVATGSSRATGSRDTADPNKELEQLLLQTNWSAIYQLFHQRFGIAAMEKLERGYIVKSAVEMTLSIVAKCFALLRSDPHGRLHCTPLHIAALQSSAEAAEVIVRDLPQLVEQTHHPSHSALCPLHIAILCSAQGIVELLLEGKANPNVRTLHDVCPMHLAATTSKELSQMLMAYAGDPQLRDVMGSNAVHYAASFKQQAVLELLLGSAQTSQRLACDGDTKRVTPLHISCALYTAEEDLAAPMALLAHGAKPWQADVSGASPRELVPWSRHSALQRFFEGCGDRPQTAAQRWVEDQYLGRGSADAAEAAEEESFEGVESGEAQAPRRPAKGAGKGGRPSAEAELAVEVERLKGELVESREQCAALEQLKRDLEHGRDKCAMLERASANQQKVFEDLQALCESARSQHQVQLEEVQRRYAAERAEWEERARTRLEAAQAEAQRESSRQLEAQRRELEAQRVELQVRLQRAEAAAADAAVAAAAVPSGGSRVTGGRWASAAGAEAGGGLQSLVKDLDEEGQRLRQLHEQERAASEQHRSQLQELRAAVRALCAKRSLQRPEDRGSSEAPGDLLAGVEAELDRLQAAAAGQERENKGLREQLQRQQEEAAALRTARAEAEDRCARLGLERQQADTKSSAHALKLETRLKDVELRTSRALAKAKADVEAHQRRCQAAEALSHQLQPTIDGLKEQLRGLEAQFAEEQVLRRKYHNQIQDMKGAIRVFCRFRPLVRREIEAGDTAALRKADAFTVELARPAPFNDLRPFQFDAVFEGSSSQEEVFADCRELVQSAVDGYNVTIFAYGQTGAGKTHTMYGNSAEPGLAPRSIDSLFEVIRREQRRGGKTFTVRTHMVEVYKQDIIDLLSDKPAKSKSLEVKRDLGHGMMYIDGVAERGISSPEELKATLAEGERKRHVTATRMNASSSRSHLLLSIIIECVVKETEQKVYGKITLCDLAGSERPKKSEVIGEALKEAIEINKSLSALGDVIEALTKGSKSVPYRNHKLTMLMQDSLGGSAKTLMFVNCSPAASNAEETQMSLKWASRARQVTNDVKRNADSKEVARLKQVIAMMSQAQNAQEEAAGDVGARSREALRAGMGIVA